MPIVIHRAPLSTHERFLSLLIEYYGGAFPLWCAPTQVALGLVHEGLLEYGQKIEETLRDRLIRVKHYQGKESFNKKIRLAMTQKIPLMAILGDQEMATSSVSLRRFGSTETTTYSLEEFYQLVAQEKAQRSSPEYSALPAL